MIEKLINQIVFVQQRGYVQRQMLNEVVHMTNEAKIFQEYSADWMDSRSDIIYSFFQLMFWFYGQHLNCLLLVRLL